jgi:putative glutamine amidotransferase
MKLASALYSSHYPFDKLDMFDHYTVVTEPEELDKDSCLVVWGGSDISPSLYDRPVGNATGAHERLSPRDAMEWALMCRAEELNIPIIGICRGAQMLCALAGGWLIQDCSGHGDAHEVVTDDKKKFVVSSLHHQMMFPFDVEHQLIAWSKYKQSQYYLDVNEPIDIPVESEFVYFPKQRGIAIQWHPEYMKVDTVANLYVKEKIKELL